MKSNAERYPGLVELFRKAIVDALKEANADGVYSPSTAALRAAAFKAMKEIVESETDPVDAMLAVNVWNAVMLCNESAFHQGLKRAIDKGEIVGLKMVEQKRATAQGYFS